MSNYNFGCSSRAPDMLARHASNNTSGSLDIVAAKQNLAHHMDISTGPGTFSSSTTLNLKLYASYT